MPLFMCPACESARLLLTKERIIICQDCLTGYRLVGDIPDFRLDHAISFKRKVTQNKGDGISPVFTVLLGDEKNQSFDVKHGHCMVVGRRVNREDDNDYTYVGRPQQAVQAYASLDPHNQRLVEKFLTRRQGAPEESILGSQKRFLGSFVRDPDFLLSDASVSRSHAIVYQDDEGVHVLDLVSRNGTYVNGYEVELTKLKNNDVLNLGTASLRVNFY